ncbi:MAG: FAD-dependent oxidoreductase [Planctomycetota bacterium]|nr:FAD-dependent oxidoreductase [Planctomycetota bacterium]MDI6787774.1 FAD-dependent oxidoreductase [Planctomycetota bacterium]
MPKRIVIIGSGTAGASAAFSARKLDRQAEITIIDKEPYSTYSRCGLPFAIQGIIKPMENLVVFPSKVFTTQKITQKLQTEAMKIDHQTRGGGEVTCRNLLNDELSRERYDTLIFATGSAPSIPPISGIDKGWGGNIFVLRTIDDAKKIMQDASVIKSATIIGASFIGLEVAEALKHYGLSVTIVEQRYLLWRMLDKEISAIIRQKVSTEGIKLIEDKTVSNIDEFSDSMVIIAAGIKPRTELASQIGVEIGKTGGIKVDNYLRTNLADVYAVGDCAEYISFLTGEPVLSGLGTIAMRQGMVAGANATGKGGGGETAPLILHSSVLRLFDMEIGSVGLTEDFIASQKTSQFNPVSALIKFSSLPHYYPGGSDIHIKLIAEREHHRIIGGQVLSSANPDKSGCAPRVNMLSLAIQNKMTTTDILKSDFCYSPPVCDIWEPITVACRALEIIQHRAKSIEA